MNATMRMRRPYPPSATTPTARSRTLGSSTCSPRPRAGVGERTSARSCRAPSPSCAGTPAAWSSCSRTSGPGTKRLGELRAGDGLWLAGPFGIGFAPPRDGRRPLLVGGGVGTAPLAIWQDVTGAEALLGFRDAARRRRLAAARRAGRDRRRLRRPQGPGHRPAARRARPRPSRRGLRVRPARDARSRARDLRRARDPAQLALESGMACGYGACFGCVVPTTDGYVRLCVDGPVLDASILD